MKKLALTILIASVISTCIIPSTVRADYAVTPTASVTLSDLSTTVKTARGSASVDKDGNINVLFNLPSINGYTTPELGFILKKDGSLERQTALSTDPTYSTTDDKYYASLSGDEKNMVKPIIDRYLGLAESGYRALFTADLASLFGLKDMQSMLAKLGLSAFQISEVQDSLVDQLTKACMEHWTETVMCKMDVLTKQEVDGIAGGKTVIIDSSSLYSLGIYGDAYGFGVFKALSNDLELQWDKALKDLEAQNNISAQKEENRDNMYIALEKNIAINNAVSLKKQELIAYMNTVEYKCIQEATLNVKTSESSLNSTVYKIACKQVSQLPSTSDTQDLQSRLDAVGQKIQDKQLQIDISSAEQVVKYAEKYPKTSYYTMALQKVTDLPDCASKTALLNRLNKVYLVRTVSKL